MVLVHWDSCLWEGCHKIIIEFHFHSWILQVSSLRFLGRGLAFCTLEILLPKMGPKQKKWMGFSQRVVFLQHSSSASHISHGLQQCTFPWTNRTTPGNWGTTPGFAPRFQRNCSFQAYFFWYCFLCRRHARFWWSYWRNCDSKGNSRWQSNAANGSKVLMPRHRVLRNTKCGVYDALAFNPVVWRKSEKLYTFLLVRDFRDFTWLTWVSQKRIDVILRDLYWWKPLQNAGVFTNFSCKNAIHTHRRDWLPQHSLTSIAFFDLHPCKAVPSRM